MSNDRENLPSPSDANTIGSEKTVGEMRRRRETMADNRRQIIYYTFGSNGESEINRASNRQSEEKN